MGAQHVRKRVQEARESWRRYEALVAELAGELRPGWWLDMWLAMELELFRTWVNIRREFGIKIKLRLSKEQEQQLMRATSREQMVEFSRALAPEQVIDSERLPHTPRAWAKWRHDALYCILLRMMTDGIEFSVTSLLLNKAIQEVKSHTLRIESLPPEHEMHTPTARGLNRKVANTLIVLASAQPYAAGVATQRSPDPVLAESATFALSGFAAANLSANPNFRHNRALTPGEQLDSLPGGVRQAWEERPAEEPLYRNPGRRSENFVARVETLLSKLGDENTEKPENVTGDLDPHLQIPPTGQFSAREGARRELNALKEKAVLTGYGLTEREDAVLELHEIEGYTHKEIADQRNVSKGTSQADLKRALIKLRRAAG